MCQKILEFEWFSLINMAKEAAIITSTTNHEYLGRKSKKHGLDKKKNQGLLSFIQRQQYFFFCNCKVRLFFFCLFFTILQNCFSFFYIKCSRTIFFTWKHNAKGVNQNFNLLLLGFTKQVSNETGLFSVLPLIKGSGTFREYNVPYKKYLNFRTLTPTKCFYLVISLFLASVRNQKKDRFFSGLEEVCQSTTETDSNISLCRCRRLFRSSIPHPQDYLWHAWSVTPWFKVKMGSAVFL